MIRHILVDLENVYSSGLCINDTGLKIDKDTKIYIMFTEHYSNISLEVLGGLVDGKLELIKVPFGKQSLDKHLIWMLGALIGKHVTKNEKARNKKENAFAIISNDTGYDNIIKMAKSQFNIYCERFSNLEQALKSLELYEIKGLADAIAYGKKIGKDVERESTELTKKLEALEKKLETNERELEILKESTSDKDDVYRDFDETSSLLEDELDNTKES